MSNDLCGVRSAAHTLTLYAPQQCAAGDAADDSTHHRHACVCMNVKQAHASMCPQCAMASLISSVSNTNRPKFRIGISVGFGRLHRISACELAGFGALMTGLYCIVSFVASRIGNPTAFRARSPIPTRLLWLYIQQVSHAHARFAATPRTCSQSDA